jgi:hypothetical protein
MHRATVLGRTDPISRTDEISPEVGCIAPNTLLNIDNTLYFLSWKGFYRYDNNVLQKIDMPFDEELQFILSTLPEEFIRDATAAYNRHYNEIWLNIPMLPTESENGKQIEYGTADMYEAGRNFFDRAEHAEGEETAKMEVEPNYFKRPIYGHIYVINLDKQYATKFGNTPSVFNRGSQNTQDDIMLKDVTDTRQLIRLYYTNSLGELRSGDIFPCLYHNPERPIVPLKTPWIAAGIYIESPYSLQGLPIFVDYDMILDGRELNTIGGVYLPTPNKWNGNLINIDFALKNYPLDYKMNTPYKSIYKSKWFTGDIETITKRVRKVVVDVFSRGNLILRGLSVPYETANPVYADDRITWTDSQKNISGIYERLLILANETFQYKPSVNSVHPLSGILQYGRSSNRAEFIPRHPYLQDLNGVQLLDTEEDWYRKPTRFSIEIESELRTQINAIVLYWKPIHIYLA